MTPEMQREAIARALCAMESIDPDKTAMIALEGPGPLPKFWQLYLPRAAKVLAERGAREPAQDEMGATERAAIVAWLRAQSDVYSSAGHHGLAVDWRMAADSIEAGEHRSEP
jgi:hypothetical protein